MAFPNPASFAKGDKDNIPEVEQLGTITLEKLNAYHCKNEERRLLSLFGDVFDVTTSEKGYGKDGACKSTRLPLVYAYVFVIIHGFCVSRGYYYQSHFEINGFLATDLFVPKQTNF
jgi:hypothetical protein